MAGMAGVVTVGVDCSRTLLTPEVGAVRSVALLVVGKTYSSGPQHEQRLDAAATEVGLERIWPPAELLPALAPVPVSIADVSRLFTLMPLGPDMSLTPPAIQSLLDSLDAISSSRSPVTRAAPRVRHFAASDAG